MNSMTCQIINSVKNAKLHMNNKKHDYLIKILRQGSCVAYLFCNIVLCWKHFKSCMLYCLDVSIINRHSVNKIHTHSIEYNLNILWVALYFTILLLMYILCTY